MFSPDLGLSLVMLTSEPTESILKVVAGSGIATMEIDARMFANVEERKSRISHIRKRTEDGNLRTASVHALFGSEYDLSSPNEAVRRNAISSVRDALSLAANLDAKIAVVHPSAEPIAPEERKARLQNTRSALSELGEFCAATGVKIAIELLPRSCLGNTAGELHWLIDDLDRMSFGVCLDTNHLMDRPETLAAIVHELQDVLTTLHISDYDGVDEKHLLPGRGVIDWAAFMRALDAIGYTGPFNYESHLDDETIDERVAALEQNFAWMRTLQQA